MSSSGSKVIVVFGATGNQGSAFVQSLSEQNASAPSTSAIPYPIIALSRSPTSASSLRLAKLPGVKVAPVDKDYMDNPTKVFRDLKLEPRDVYGVFSVQGYVDEATELKQGKAIVDAAHALGVRHFIYSSVDFGGLADTGVSGFEVKRAVESYIKSLSPPLPYTALRPAQLMDNLLPTSPFFLKISRTILLRKTFIHHPERKHQFVSTRDIGRMGAKAIAEGQPWIGKEVRLAGSEVTMPELEVTYQQAMGKPIELSYEFLAGFVQWMVPVMAQMSRYFDNHGFGIDIDQVKQALPDVEDLGSFLLRYRVNRS